MSERYKYEAGERKQDLPGDLFCLLGDICVLQGFCNQVDAYDSLESKLELTADDFAVAVLMAEGMNPDAELSWRQKISEIFKNRYGPSVSPETYEPPLEVID